ncbi:MAG: TonB-dependent receptor domain-containing protein [Vicinamibacteraceae bacterium]
MTTTLSRLRWTSVVWICGALLARHMTPVHAQFDTAVVLGTVRDATGGVLPGTSITLENTQTGIATVGHTDEQGNYLFPNVRIGTYAITAELQGFSTATAKNVRVAVNARQRVDLTLHVGTIGDEVLVTASPQLLETDSSERGQVIERRQIVSLPLNGRSYANLSLLTTGVLESNQNGIGTSGREGSFNVNGLRNTMNNFQLDGIDNNAYGTSNQGFSNQVIQVSPDAVAEFKVQTNNYSAEYGRSGGAVVNASYRSGTNDLHGSLWEFHRNTVLNATGFFKPTGGSKPSLIRNQFGFVVGGPVVRDRAFFFMDYEGFRQTQRTLVCSTIPTLEQRQGVLSVPVANPFTGERYAAGTRIPLTDFARKVLSELPAPNVPGATSSNYQKSVPNESDYNKLNLRLDHKFSDSLSAFVRLGQQKNDAFEAPNIDGPSGGGQNGFIDVLSQQLVLGATYVLGSSSVLDARLGISRMEAGKQPTPIGGPSMRELYGITGLPENDPALTGGLTPQTITGFSQLGRQSTNPQFQNPFTLNPRVSVTNVFGRHSVKVGFELLAMNTDVQDTNPLYGLDTYSSELSRPADADASSLYNLADFYVGARTQYQWANLIVAKMRQRAYYAYVQDDFNLNSRLTLNMGLRYEYMTPYYEAENRMSNFDPETNSIVMASDGSVSERALVDPDRNNFAPRLGFAFQLTDDTVLRGGYGIGYVHVNRLASAGLLATNYPIITRATVTQSLTEREGSEHVGLCRGDEFVDCFRTTQQGYPPRLPNDVILYIPRESPAGRIQNWHFSVQRKLTDEVVIDLGYVGNNAKNLAMLADFNQARPPLPGEDPNLTLQARRPLHGFGTISAVLPEAFSSYHGFQARFEYRASNVNVLNSFTWSKAIDNVSQVLEEPNGSSGTPQNIYDIDADRGLSAYDVPLMNVTSVVWSLPVGRGQRFGNRLPPLLEGVLGGWQISGIYTMRSGRTVNLRYNTSGPTPVTSGLPSFLGGVGLRPNLLGDPMAPEGERSIDHYFDKDNIVLPPPTEPFGNAGRNVVRGYPFYQLDLAVQKEFPLPFGRETRLEIRAEGFNVLNESNFGAPNGDLSSGAFGTIRSTFPARQVQLAAKITF